MSALAHGKPMKKRFPHLILASCSSANMFRRSLSLHEHVSPTKEGRSMSAHAHGKPMKKRFSLPILYACSSANVFRRSLSLHEHVSPTKEGRSMSALAHEERMQSGSLSPFTPHAHRRTCFAGP